MFASIINGCVAEVTETLPAPGTLFVECGPQVQVGWSLSEGALVGPPVPTDEEQLLLAVVAITAAYDLKRKGLKDRMAIALLQDGESEEIVRAALAVEWQQANADEEFEILSLLGG